MSLAFCAERIKCGNVALTVIHEPMRSMSITALNALSDMAETVARKLPAAPALYSHPRQFALFTLFAASFRKFKMKERNPHHKVNATQLGNTLINRSLDLVRTAHIDTANAENDTPRPAAGGVRSYLLGFLAIPSNDARIGAETYQCTDLS
jgi:hypothetical protein